MTRKEIATIVYDWVSRSSAVVVIAVRVRNICNALIGHSVIYGHDPETNGEVRLIRIAVRRARVVFDVGANVGDWTALALDLMLKDARIVCFEPSRTAGEYLERRFGRDPRVELIHAAVADTPGRRTFFEEPNAGESSSLMLANTRGDVQQRSVDVTTVDAEARRLGVDRIDMLKIDCEGFDLAVLRGAQGMLGMGGVRVVQFEYNLPWSAAGATLRAGIDLLRSSGYVVYAVTPDGLREFDYARFGETFTYANFAALAPGEEPRDYVAGVSSRPAWSAGVGARLSR